MPDLLSISASLLPFHFFGMLMNVVALVLTIRDLYLRSFPKENDKLTWHLLILLTGGIGWIIYVFKYARKPRPSKNGSMTEHPSFGDNHVPTRTH